ncbi:MAG: sigma-70 family RNA polymerase sigma factor [Dermatophilaceae bacterium]
MSLVSSDDRMPPEPGLSAAEPENWVEALSIPGPGQDHAMNRLHEMMLRASRHQVRRMRSALAGVGDERLEEIANQAADEAMMTLLTKLHTFQGRSRFTTWAYKFAILQCATEVRRFAWAHREVELDDLTHVQEASPSPASYIEAADLASAVRRAIDVALTPHQRRITIALLIDEVPIDVLAQRLGTNRNALYKTVHDARTRLRTHLIASGHLATPNLQAGTS